MNFVKKLLPALIALCFLQTSVFSQDIIYARKVIKFLTSKKCFGRGYFGQTQFIAAKFIYKELHKAGLQAFKNNNYFQPFVMPVNSFPKKMEVIVDGKKLIPGVHFIVGEESESACGQFSVFKKDSITFEAANLNGRPILIQLKKKLTWSVSQKTENYLRIELLKDSFLKDIKKIDVNVENKFIPNFNSQNICGFIPGAFNTDSFIVFTSHYDHLGAMGSKTFFPGANDNASGVSMLLQLMNYYAKYPSKYTVVFMFFAGEEAGLVGSKFFIENPLFSLKKIKFLLNLDLMGTGQEGITVVNATEFQKEFGELISINSIEKLFPLIKSRGKAANSDHYWFSENNVRCFFIYTMGGIKAYHDIYDVELTLPLAKNNEIFILLTKFIQAL